MKRILAVFLTLAMALNIAPVAAFAAADSDAASIVVEETDENASSRLDEETVRAIASDPFLQAAYAQTEQEQTQQKATSEMSVTGTNSLGKLLVNGIEEQNGASGGSTSRVTKLKMDGSTAEVTFVTESAADLVVAVYTDSTAEEMVASGTVKVFSGDTSALVTIRGEFPEYYTVKAFLLAPESHEPLSPVYTDQSNNEAIKDLENATADKFPEDRVIQLDNQDTTTNFAVVNNNTTLVTYENNTDDRNQVIEADDDGLEYIIGNPDESIRSLQPGRILTYEYEPGQLLIVRVKSIEVEDDRVTIQGDDDLELTDVFDVLKLEESAGSGEFIHSDEGMDPAVEYLGVHEDTTDQTNKVHIEDGGITDTIPIVDTNVHDFKVDGSGKSDAAGSLTAKVTGTLSLNVNMDFAYFISAGRQYALLSDEVNLSGSVSVSGAVTTKFPLGLLHTPKGLQKLGVEAEITPNFVVEVTAKFSFKFQYSQYTEFYYSNTLPDGYEDRSEPGKGSVEPVKENGTSTSVEIQIFVGVEIGPKIDALDKLHMECKLKGGGQVILKLSDPGDGIKHDCAICFDISMSVVGKLTISLIIWKKDLTKGTIPAELKFLDIKLGDFYWSLDYDEFGADHCPHLSYRVRTQLDGISKAGITIYERDYTSDALHPTTTKLGTTDANGTFDAYLKPGWHELVAVVNQNGEDKEYSGQVTLGKKPTTLVLKTKAGTVTPNPDPDTPDTPVYDVWTLKNGVLTVEKMGFYSKKEDVPWNDSRDKIKEIVIAGDMITLIEKYAFEDCTNLTKVTFNRHIAGFYDNAFKGCTSITDVYCLNDTMSQWLKLDAGKGNESIMGAKIHCTDGTILSSGTCGKSLNWILLEDGTLRITGTGNMDADPTWPKEQIVKVVVGKGATSISAKAFMDCTNLTTISLPETLRTIGTSAFYGCSNLDGVTLPSSLTAIGTSAFAECTALTSVAIPSGVTTVNMEAFKNCKSLTEVTVAAGVQKIDDNVFEGCENLESILLPSSLKTLGWYAFQNCKSLKSVTIPNGVTSIGDQMFMGCSSLTEVSIQGKVTEIGKGAFKDCTNLESISLPDSVSKIDWWAFDSCTKLKSINLPAGLKELGFRAFMDCSSLESITIPGGVQVINSWMFMKCTNLQSAVIQPGVTAIEDGAFQECINLENLELPDTLQKIGAAAFSNCDKLTEIKIPAGVTEIERSAFTECPIEEITIPAGVTKIMKDTFEYCKELRKVDLPAGLTEIGKYAFFGCEKLQSIIIPDGVTTLNERTFEGCKALAEISLPENLTTIIGDYVFFNCKSLKTINYRGTMAQWNTNPNVCNKFLYSTIHCTDGDIVPNTENSITTGTASASDSKFQAAFADAKAGKEYVVLVSRSGSDPLNADNLIYINQITADADGELTVPFITAADAADAAEMTYVVACAQDGATVDPDQPSQPDKPGGDEPSSGGGDGGGAAIILIGGVAAVAAVAGAVMLMPVKVEGTVKLAGQPVANASVQVLKNGNVAAQTTTDANGHFTVKVKRGGYTLRVQWTDAESQPVVRTVDFKAPNANLNVAA